MFLDPGAHKNSSILTKNAYISPEESEVRIIWIATFIAFGLSVTSGVLLGLTLFHKYSNHEPVVVYPKIPKDQYGMYTVICHTAGPVQSNFFRQCFISICEKKLK